MKLFGPELFIQSVVSLVATSENSVFVGLNVCSFTFVIVGNAEALDVDFPFVTKCGLL